MAEEGLQRGDGPVLTARRAFCLSGISVVFLAVRLSAANPARAAQTAAGLQTPSVYARSSCPPPFFFFPQRNSSVPVCMQAFVRLF